MMLTGRINWRYGVTVILGCFILFGASSIVAGGSFDSDFGTVSAGLERDTLFVGLPRPQMYASLLQSETH
jgi:hypothetical protein